MRLSKIKLAGFKSFVDPTTIPFPSNLVGVVGPNGCGKSNIIDAIRWVMGESSAKHLRGGTMDDVIFNGSSARKPIGQASVELVFDNSDRTLGGEYAQYNEISVKRVVNRDGHSVYHLNGTRCRRRDITDIFLGTGLGPRSYAIIEQGMISRLIEAKPEEIRVYLEEAAGISKYKERRRETENRIRHTRENLDRLNDLREEVAKHLEHLARQKRTAERYRELRSEARRVEGELLALKWRDMQQETERREQRLAAEQTRLEEAVAEQRRAESGIEQARERHHEATELFNGVQGRYYRIGAEISATEQQIQYSRESRQRSRDELTQLEQEIADTATHIESDQKRLHELDESLASDQPQHEELRQIQDQAAEALAAAEQAMQQWQAEWEAFNQRAAEPAQAAQVQRSRMEQLERHLEQVRQRLARLQEEQQNLDPGGVSESIRTLEAEDEEATAETARLQGQLDANGAALNSAREAQQAARKTLDQAREAQQEVQGRKASLEALQAAALGQSNESAMAWLEQEGLSDRPRLAQALDVEPGWERAVEAVLGTHLEAICVDGIGDFAVSLASLERGGLTLLDRAAQVHAQTVEGETLLDRVRGDVPVSSLLARVFTAPTLSDALQRRAGLAAEESLVTPDGVHVGPNWIRVVRPVDEQGGVLDREQALHQANAELETVEQRVRDADHKLSELVARVEELERERESIQQALNQAHRTHAEISSRLDSARVRQEQLTQRQHRLDEEIRELQEQVAREEGELESATHARSLALEQSEAFDSERSRLQEKRTYLAEELTQAQEKARTHRDEGHRIELRVESMRSTRNATAQNLERMEVRLQQLHERREQLRESLDSSDEPIRELETTLQEKVEQRLAIEREMGEARAAVEQVEQELREFEQQRTAAERRASEIREQVQQERMAVQEVQVRRQTIEEQLAAEDLRAEALLGALSEEADTPTWNTRLEDLTRKIDRLGPVNLAAIDEHEEENERKQYLDAQYDDVTQALETLENAIGKIDRETRSRFKHTFDQVNSQLQALFPRLFGGGSAHLEMTGDDLLSTGVSIMARPPGKRIANIHLLSGGEKALTAVALVFAFFELNPAPFCLLDEVDAPLDDANVGRYCELVREMSERVQFIFITHNKQTMELTHQLTGVTMREPGVSRLVAVDVQEAAAMAEA